MKYQKWEEHWSGEQQTEICVCSWDSALSNIYADTVLLKTMQELGFASCCCRWSPAICSAVRDSEDGFWLNGRTACSKVSWRNFWGKKCGSTAVVKAVFWLDVCVQQPAGCDSLLEQSVATAGTGLHRSNSYGRCEIKRWKKNAGIGFCVGIGGEKSRAIRQQYRAVCSGICWLTGARWEPGRSCRPGAKSACLPSCPCRSISQQVAYLGSVEKKSYIK